MGSLYRAHSKLKLKTHNTTTMTLVSMLCTPSSTNCDCHYSITGENASSWAWQEFGIFAAADSAAPARRQRYFEPIPDGTCQLNKRSHEDDNGASISQPKPAKRAKESQNNDNTTSSTVSLSEEENKCTSSSTVGQRGGGSPACIIRGGGTDGQSMQGTQPTKNPIDQQISIFLMEEADPLGLEEECVCPHPPTNDVLSRLACTPFDADRMKACYKQNRDGMNPTITTSDMIKPLTIISQNEFIKGRSQRKLIATINRDVSAFLLNEAAKIPLEEQEEAPSQTNTISTKNSNESAALVIQNGTNSQNESPSRNGSLNANNSASIPIQSLNTNDNPHNYDISLTNKSIANFGIMHDDTVAFLCYNEGVEATNQIMQSGDVVVAMNGRSTIGLPGNAVLEMLHSGAASSVLQLTLVERKWYMTQTAPKTEADAKKNYDEAFKFSLNLRQRHRNLSQKVPNDEMMKSLNASKHHFGVAEKLREAAWWKLRSIQTHKEAKKLTEVVKATEAKKAAEAKKEEDVPSATASDVMKISHANLSKLPVAFGFRLRDKSSKSAATAATTKWRVEGKKASNSIFIGKNTPSSKGTPESRHNAAKSTAPRSSAVLLSTELMSSAYPGWTKKRFERTSGNTAGTKDTYFYSPHQQIKFRAMKGVDTFIRILSEPDVDGDESKAMVLYKQRGYKN